MHRLVSLWCSNTPCIVISSVGVAMIDPPKIGDFVQYDSKLEDDIYVVLDIKPAEITDSVGRYHMYCFGDCEHYYNYEWVLDNSGMENWKLL